MFTHFGGKLFVVFLMMLHPTQGLEPPVFAKSAMNDGAGGIPRASGAINESPFAGKGAARFFAFILNS